MADEYAVKVTVRNGLILRQMKKLGIKSQTELAELSGVSPSMVGMLIRLKRRPLSAVTGEWLSVAFALSSALRLEPEELWTEKQRGMALESNSREVSMGEEEVMQLASGQGTEQMVQKVLTTRAVDSALKLLPPREEQVVRRVFLENETLEEISDDLGVTRERVRQISLRALRRLKHKSHPGKLEQQYKGLENE
jgi:DNA-binding CsgD family transcriptional regulator